MSEVEEVPAGERLLCSTHGIAPSVRRISAERQPKVFDTTCPLVTKVHMEVVRFSQLQATIALLGHCRHDELIGTIGEAPERTIVGSTRREAKTVEVPRSPVAYLTQTTHSLDEADVIIGVLRRQFPHVQAPPEQDICYAAKNRQCATRRVEADADLLLVVRSENSSNLQRTVEVDRGRGLTAYLIDHEADIAPSWRSAASRIAVSAGHSAPEAPAQRVVRHQREAGFQEVQEQKLVEGTVHSPLPSELGATQQLTQIAVHP